VTDFKPKLDLLETRRQLVAMRSLHSHDRRVAIEINQLIRKIAHLHQPDNLAHEKRLIEMIAQTWRAVELHPFTGTSSTSARVNPESFAQF
jgi:hypothetical protein